MIKTVEAIVEEKGNVKLLEQVRLGVPRRALVTILDEKPAARASETALSSEASPFREVLTSCRLTSPFTGPRRTT